MYLTVGLTLRLIELRLHLHRILHTSYCLLNTDQDTARRETTDLEVQIIQRSPKDDESPYKSNPFCPSDIFPLARGKLNL